MQKLDIPSMLIGMANGKGGSAITVEELNVTENGTYTADTGKAYSPVTVNVPVDVIDLTRPANLPAEYAEVKYNIFDGNTYIVVQNGVTNKKLTIWSIDAKNEQEDAETRSVVGFRTNNTNATDWYANITTTGGGVVYYRGEDRYAGLIKHADGKYGLNRIYVSKFNNATGTTQAFYIGCYYSYLTNYQTFIGKIGCIVIRTLSSLESNSEYMRYLVPCIRIADDVVGYYDLVSNTFLTASAGTLVAGERV